MGTRHLTIVELNKEIKVAQYGQWDGNPLGQGEIILKFILEYLIKNEYLEEFKDILKDYKFLSEEERDKIYNSNWKSEYPQLSRDIGAEILNLIFEDKIPEVLINSINFAGDSLFCEWAYLLDLDNEVLEIYRGFNKEELSKENRFYDIPLDHNEYRQVKLWKKFEFGELSKNTMEKLEQEWEKEDE